MKKILLLLSVCISFSSCCTLFSSSKQDITFTGMNGTKISIDQTENSGNQRRQ